MAAGRLAEARQELEKYLTLDPQNSEARYHYLLILFKMKDYGETIRQADLILKEHPQFIPGLLYRGLSHQALGRPEKAQDDFQAAADQADITPEDRRFALNMLVDLALQQKNYALALKRLEDLGKLEEDFNLSYRRGLALEGSGRLAEAETAYRRALEQAQEAPERVRAYRALGELARKRQDWPPPPRPSRRPRNWNRTTRRCGGPWRKWPTPRKTMTPALIIQRALALRSTSQDREFFINVLGLLKDYQEATDRLTRLLAEAQTPEERYRIYTALGNTYTKWGKFGEAARAFQEAASIKDDLPVLEALAQTREREGRSGQAVALYREMLKRQPSPQVHLKLGLLLGKNRGPSGRGFSPGTGRRRELAGKSTAPGL